MCFGPLHPMTSILDYLVGVPSLKVEAKGSKFLQENVFDMTMAQLKYPDDVHAHIFVSWLHPFKEHRLVVIGSKGMITFEDSSMEKNILYHNKRIDWVDGKPIKVEEPDEIITYEKGMPLTELIFYREFGWIIDIASGKSGHEVVKVLGTVQELITSKES